MTQQQTTRPTAAPPHAPAPLTPSADAEEVLLASFHGSAPKAYWYLSRASAFAAYGLLWSSMALGLAITNKLV